MEEKSQLKSGAILSYVTLIVGNIISLVYFSIMIKLIGPEEHGLYGTAQSVMSYLNLLSFGFGNSIVRYVTKYRALNDKEKEEKTVGLFLMVYAVLSILVIAVGFTISMFTEQIYAQTLVGEQFNRMRTLLILMSVNVAIIFMSTVFSSVIIAHERFVFNKLLALLTTVLSPCVSIVLILCGFASVGMTLAGTVIAIITFVGYMVYCLKRLDIKPRFKNPDFDLLKEIIRFSAFIFLMEIANMLYNATDRLLLGTMASTVAVSIYTTGAQLSEYLNTFTTAISGVLMPRVTTMIYTGASKKDIDDIFIRVGRLQFIIISFLISSFVVFGRQFMPMFADVGYDNSYWIAIILMVPLAVPLIQSVAVNIITARNKHKFRSLVLLGVAILNVGLTLGAIHLGLEGIGAAIATAIAALIGTITIMNWYYYKKMDLDIPRFWKEILKLCPIPVIMMIVGLVVTYFVDVNGVVRFLTGAVIFTLIYVPLVWKTSFNEYERNLFGGIFRKIKSKLGKGTK